MLVEHYPTDKRFEELLGYVPELSLELKKIDGYLEDEKLYRLIRTDLSKRCPKTRQTGRNSTPVEVVLRMLVVKRLYGYSYEETERAGERQSELEAVLSGVSAMMCRMTRP